LKKGLRDKIMTKKEYVERNIGMTFDFIRHLIDHPEVINTIPDGAELDFIDKDMSFKVKRPCLFFRYDCLN
jgi:hypothetical protein